MLQRIKQNFVLNSVRRIGRLLSSKQRRWGIRIAIGTVFGAITDVLGIAAMVPVMLAATDPEFIYRNQYMQALYQGLGFETRGGFMIFLALALLVIFILKNGFALLLNYLQSKYAYSVATSMARRQFIKYYHRGFLYFKETNSADIINNIINIPAFFAANILISSINLFCEGLVMLLIVVGIAVNDIWLFFALIAILLPSGFIIYASTKNKLYRLGIQQSDLRAQVFSRLNQSIFGYVDVKLNNKEVDFLNAYTEDQDQLNRTSRIRYIIGLIPTRSLEVIAVVGIVVIFLYTFLFASSSEALFGFIAVFAAAAFRVLPSMNRLLVALMGMKGNEYTLDILEDGTLPYEMEDIEAKPVVFEREISFKDISFHYEDSAAPAVKNLSFEVKKGEKIGIVGESGSGKTTLMNILLRFLVESDGGIYVDGKKLMPEDIPGWRAIMGYVQQGVYLMDASLKENVAFGEQPDQIDEKRLKQAIEKASLGKFVDELPKGVNTIIGEMGSKLSGGQRQRIGIARALYWNSSILVFDEATSALDHETEQAITDSIERLGGEHTIFVIAHRVTTLRFCDRILEMSDGKLAGIHSYEELIAKTLQ